LTEAARRALELRQALAKSSVSKLETLAARVSPDGRVRHNYKFYGAHTGRWAGEGVQLQNLPRGTVKDVEAVTAAILIGGTLPCPALEAVSSCLRSAFRAPEGYRFVVSDLAQIELRVLAWLAQCSPLLSALAAGADIYTDFAAEELYHVPSADVTKRQRQVAKSAVLGCGYGLGPGEEKKDKNGDAFLSGLLGYGANMGVDITPEEAAQAVQAFRYRYPQVPDFWRTIERAVTGAVALGEKYTVGPISVGALPRKLLWLTLPSGRRLHYLRPRIETGAWPDGQPKRVIAYEGVKIGKTWGRKETYGGHLTENLCQAIARDVLGEGMLRAETAGFEIVGHSHDEVITLVPEGSPLGVGELNAALVAPMTWAPDLLLSAEGWTGQTYKK